VYGNIFNYLIFLINVFKIPNFTIIYINFLTLRSTKLHKIYKTNKIHCLENRIYLQKPIISQIAKKFQAFHGTRISIVTATRARCLSVSWTTLVQSTSSQHVSSRYILIVFTSCSYVFICLSPPCFLSETK